MTEESKKVIKAKENTRKNLNLVQIEELLRSNEYSFPYKGVTYKVKKPTFGQKQEAYDKRLEKEIEMIQAKNDKGKPKHKSRDELIEIYKERGIDVDGLNSKFISLEKKKNDLQMKLGKGLKEKKPENELTIYHDEIEKIKNSQQEISIKKTQLFQASIENRLDIFIYAYLTYLITEKLVEDKWIKMWNSYEEFKQTPEDIINEISYYAVMIVQNEV